MITSGRPKLRQFARRGSHLADDRFDADIGAQIVAGNGDADAVRVQPRGEMAEKGTVQRLPVPAMDKDDDRAVAVTGKKSILFRAPEP